MFKCQIYTNNSRRHFFIKSVIFWILANLQRIFYIYIHICNASFFEKDISKDTRTTLLIHDVLTWHHMKVLHTFSLSRVTTSKTLILRKSVCCDEQLLLVNSKSHRRCSVKKMFLNISQNSQKNMSMGVFFLINL